MKGEIFNLLELFIVENFGREKFEQIFEEIHSRLITKEPFVGPLTYPDADFLAILGHAVSTLGVPLNEAVYSFGKFCFPHLGSKMPDHVASFNHPKPFLMSIDRVIHVEVKKIYRDAETPKFTYVDTGPSSLTMIYQSKRKLYDLVEGLVQGAAEHFKHPIQIVRNVRPDDCEFSLTFASEYSGPTNPN